MASRAVAMVVLPEEVGPERAMRNGPVELAILGSSVWAHRFIVSLSQGDLLSADEAVENDRRNCPRGFGSNHGLEDTVLGKAGGLSR